MPTIQRRIRADYDSRELRQAREFVARKAYPCSVCPEVIQTGERYVRISETRIPWCHRHYSPDAITEVTR